MAEIRSVCLRKLKYILLPTAGQTNSVSTGDHVTFCGNPSHRHTLALSNVGDMSFVFLCRFWQRWTGMVTVANTNWGTNWSKPSIWCLGAAERRRMKNGLMDLWIDGGVGRKSRGGGSQGILFSELFEQSAELLRVGLNWRPQLQSFSDQSISNLFVNWLIDWFDLLADWDPNYLRLVGFGEENQFPNRFGYIYNMTSLWKEVILWIKKPNRDASVGLDLDLHLLKV